MSIKANKDYTGTKFFFKAFKASKLINGSMRKVKTKLVIVCCGLRVDVVFN